MRARFLLRLLVAAVVAIILAVALIRYFQATILSAKGKPSVTTSKASRTDSHLIERSVLIRYGDTDPLVIFSAFSHSDRITVILAAYGYLMRRLFCRLFDEQMQEILPSGRTLVFPEFTVRCPASDIARFVALSLNPDDTVTLQDTQAIDVPNKGEKAFFSVCLAPLWGDTPKWLMLVEFIEYYKLQGAERFFIYRQTVSNQTQAVIDSYVRDGIADVVDINGTTKCLKRHRCRHEMQLQDCIFRTRGRTAWVATVDLDERISINGGEEIKKYVKSIGSPTIGEMRFRCRWVLRSKDIPSDYAQWKIEGSHLPIAEWHNTSHVAPLNHTTKSIVQPMKVESMGVHQVIRFAPDATVLLVPPEDAVVRHYRLTKGWSFFLKETETFGSFEETFLPSKMVETLALNVNQRTSQLFSAF